MAFATGGCVFVILGSLGLLVIKSHDALRIVPTVVFAFMASVFARLDWVGLTAQLKSTPTAAPTIVLAKAIAFVASAVVSQATLATIAPR